MKLKQNALGIVGLCLSGVGCLLLCTVIGYLLLPAGFICSLIDVCIHAKEHNIVCGIIGMCLPVAVFLLLVTGLTFWA